MTTTGTMIERSEALRAEKSFANLFRLTCALGDTPAALWLEGETEKRVLFAEYPEITRRMAAWLRETLGEKNEGRFAALALDTSPEWPLLYWSLLQAGYCVLLLDPSQSEKMTEYLLRQAGAFAIVQRKNRALAAEFRQITAAEALAARGTPAPKGFKPRFADKTALCTSGTTDTSRVFVYSEQALCEQALSTELLYKQNKRFISDERRRMLAFLPFHHVFGFLAGLLWANFAGFTEVYLKDRAPETILRTCQRFRVQTIVTVPLLANNLCVALGKKVHKESRVKRAAFAAMKGVSLAAQSVLPTAGLKLGGALFRGVQRQLLGTDIDLIILGGSHAPAEHIRTMNALGYYTTCGFGMTETAVTSVETTMALWPRVTGSVGRPLSNTQYRVRGGGEDSRRGEMLIRGASIHTGRLVDGKLLPPALDSGGWYETGDVVRLEKGDRMYVEGRIKDVIINESGENVYPDELEDVFAAMTGVEQLCVLGIRREGKKSRYEDITLVVNVGDRYRDRACLETLAREARDRNAKLPVLKRVTRVLVTPERLPLVNGIKVKRLALKTAIEDKKLAYRDLTLRDAAQKPAPQETVEVREVAPADLQMEEIKQKVRRLYAEALDVPAETLRDDAHFIDELGGDSLQVLSIALKIEELFSVLIPVEEYGSLTTINDMASYLYGRIRGDKAFEHDAARAPQEDIAPITRFEDAPEYQAFIARQQALMASGDDNPYFVCFDKPLRDESVMDGHPVLNFGSYNYVGMSGRKEVQEAAKAAIDRYGTSASGSRLLGGEKKLYQQLESEIAAWKHAEAALVLVGGHSTNVTIVGHFCGANDLIVYDALAHNSIAEGCRLSRATSKPFPHNDAAALESILRTQRDKFAKVLIVVEGAYSMDGDIACVPAFVALKKKYGCFLMVDEAHSACVIGATGGGVDEYFGLQPDDIDIKMGTLSKGLGACGGYLAGRRCLIEYLRYNLPGFVFSVGISPPLAAAVRESVRLLREDPSIMARMAHNIETFVREARARGFNTCLAGETAIIPILVGRDEDAFLLSNRMREEGVFVPPAVYPAVPKNKARLRFCVISEHHDDQIIKALDTLKRLTEETGIALPPPAPPIPRAKDKKIEISPE